ncbi:MAG: tRNA (N6-isopentenyl adenosine(37)-C2)-methylthiotransferase MiaB [Deltaproteobacteria bacterium]|nr:tRNA (N6-isopentenyl adenosine(37)-C2)-methylthiotransferase MiaB [Deltaproteobacteria bacterium]
MNVYDSGRMGEILKAQGMTYEERLGEADVILINTCSIRDKAEHKVLSLLGQLKPLKEKNPKRVIGVAGCVGQRIGRQLLQRVPHLDFVVGPDGIDHVGELVDGVVKRGERCVDAKLDTDGRSYSQPLLSTAPKVAEYITVMKGCDHFCTYCIVPFVRGREKSRSIQEIVGDVERLVAQGTKEVTFLGQNINTYGKGSAETLAQLIERTHEVRGLERIRYVTSHPRDMGMDLISQFGNLEKLCPALHLPFQSGSDAVLKRMSRLYTSAEYLKKIAALREACPDIALSADVIVGFPGETDEDFEQTMTVLSEVRFSLAFLFTYSPRPGTKAYELSDDVSREVKEERLARTMKLTMEIIEEENRKRIGGIESVLVESIDKKKGRYFFGRSLHNKIVHVLNAGPACVGKVIDVEVTEANGSNLKGYYVDAERIDRVASL